MTTGAIRVYVAEDFAPYGASCSECKRVFVEGQPIAEVLESIEHDSDEPLMVVSLVCRACARGDIGGQNFVPLSPDLQAWL